MRIEEPKFWPAPFSLRIRKSLDKNSAPPKVLLAGFYKELSRKNNNKVKRTSEGVSFFIGLSYYFASFSFCDFGKMNIVKTKNGIVLECRVQNYYEMIFIILIFSILFCSRHMVQGFVPLKLFCFFIFWMAAYYLARTLFIWVWLDDFVRRTSPVAKRRK